MVNLGICLEIFDNSTSRIHNVYSVIIFVFSFFFILCM